MRYALLICSDGPPTAAEIEAGCGGWTAELTSRGVLKGGGGLQPPSDATTIRVRDNEVLLTDGPFAETKEQMGGFCVIECADLDEAVEIAARHPAARSGMIEIRPLIPVEGA